MKAILKDALQQRQHEEGGRRGVKRHKRVLRRAFLVSEAHHIAKRSTYGKLELGGNRNYIPELFDPHCDDFASLKTS